MHRALRTCLTLASLSIATPLVAGAPWISIELPANRIDPETRGAHLVVRTYHHATAVQLVMRGPLSPPAAECSTGCSRRSAVRAYHWAGSSKGVP